MVGEDLASDDAAWRYAMALTRDIEASFQPGDTWRLEVMQADGLVYSLDLKSKAHAAAADRTRSR